MSQFDAGSAGPANAGYPMTFDRRRSYQNYTSPTTPSYSSHHHQQPQPQSQQHQSQPQQPLPLPLPFNFSAPTHAHDSLRYNAGYPIVTGADNYGTYNYPSSGTLAPLVQSSSSTTTPLSYVPARFDNNSNDYYSNLLHNPILPRPITTIPPPIQTSTYHHHNTPLSLYAPQASVATPSLQAPLTSPLSAVTPLQPPSSPKVPEVEACTKNFAAGTKDPDLSVWGDPCDPAPALQPGGKRRVFCWYCDKIFDDRKWVQRHAENHFFPAWECNLCHNRAHRPDVLERHCKVTCLKSHNRQGEDPKDHVKKTSPLARERAETWRKQHGKEPLRASKKARVTGPCDSPAVPLFAPGYQSTGSGATSPSVVSLTSSRSNSHQGP